MCFPALYSATSHQANQTIEEEKLKTEHESPFQLCLHGPQAATIISDVKGVHKERESPPLVSTKKRIFLGGKAVFKVTPLINTYIWESEGFARGLREIKFVQVTSAALCSKAELGVLPTEHIDSL